MPIQKGSPTNQPRRGGVSVFARLAALIIACFAATWLVVHQLNPNYNLQFVLAAFTRPELDGALALAFVGAALLGWHRSHRGHLGGDWRTRPGARRSQPLPHPPVTLKALLLPAAGLAAMVAALHPTNGGDEHAVPKRLLACPALVPYPVVTEGAPISLPSADAS